MDEPLYRELLAIVDERKRQLAERDAIIAAMKEWMDERLEKLRPKSPLRGAILYRTSRWDAFTRLVDSGDIPLENNATERAIKLPVIGRKNSLFFGSVAGGHAAMALYSLMATCCRHCIDPSA